MVYGALDQIRTDDPFLTMEVLYLLSYEGKIGTSSGLRTLNLQIKSLLLCQLS